MPLEKIRFASALTSPPGPRSTAGNSTNQIPSPAAAATAATPTRWADGTPARSSPHSVQQIAQVMAASSRYTIDSRSISTELNPPSGGSIETAQATTNRNRLPAAASGSPTMRSRAPRTPGRLADNIQEKPQPPKAITTNGHDSGLSQIAVPAQTPRREPAARSPIAARPAAPAMTTAATASST